MFAIIRRNWQMYRRYFPFTLFINRILGSAFQLVSVWLIANFLFNNRVDSLTAGYMTTAHYFTYAAIGILFYNLGVATLMNVGRALITEVREGTLMSLLITPYKVFQYFSGVFLEQLWRTLLEFAALFGISKLLDADFSTISLGAWTAGIAFTIWVSFGMSIFLANIMLQLRDTYISQNTLFILIYLVSGITFPKEILPKFLQWIGNLLPLTQALEAFRILCFRPEKYNQLASLFIVGLLSSSLYLLAGLYWYRKTEQKIISYIFE
ncbi:ABC transporter permease [Enterococcus sp. BWR-S5]|uniref:ABC transporter permease n=1 Tax=Enterococcus sp. BWR-S5 TaxID=2787714 RepID=UPI001F3E3922|nr:ABC transporter permease [Enterococcus sp. BWR-S5]